MQKYPIEVLVVDDSAVVRQTLSDILNSDPDITVMATAPDPYVAASKMQQAAPDVITLDIEMPRMDGLSFLTRIMKQHPLPVIICSSMAVKNSDNALRVLQLGAVDIIEKPKLGTRQFLRESTIRICDAVKAAAGVRVKAFKEPPRVAAKLSADAMLKHPDAHARVVSTTEKLIIVGASTGGTEALRTFLEVLPPDCPGLVIVQHMPESFTKAFAERLNGICRIEIKEADSGDTVLRGRALIAPGNRHTLLKRSGARYYVEVKDGPLVSRHRPSVDVLFRSAARYAGPNAVGIIMTGMGDDGATGLLEMKTAGAYTIAQDEASCVVFGMPNEAIKRGAVDRVLSLEKIAAGALLACKNL